MDGPIGSEASWAKERRLTAREFTGQASPKSDWLRVESVNRVFALTVKNYSSMIPRFRAMIAAWVRSLAPNLERMLLTRLFTDSSVVES